MDTYSLLAARVSCAPKHKTRPSRKGEIMLQQWSNQIKTLPYPFIHKFTYNLLNHNTLYLVFGHFHLTRIEYLKFPDTGWGNMRFSRGILVLGWNDCFSRRQKYRFGANDSCAATKHTGCLHPRGGGARASHLTPVCALCRPTACSDITSKVTAAVAKGWSRRVLA